jgi:hypothetical protein
VDNFTLEFFLLSIFFVLLYLLNKKDDICGVGNYNNMMSVLPDTPSYKCPLLLLIKFVT